VHDVPYHVWYETQPARNRLAPGVPCHLGYGLPHPIALEGAPKLKEITNAVAHGEGQFSSGFKHSPLSAVCDSYPVVLFAAPGDEMMMVNYLNEVTTRGGWAINVAVENEALRANGHEYLAIPDCPRFLAPILLTLPPQFTGPRLSAGGWDGLSPDGFPGAADRSGLALRAESERDLDDGLTRPDSSPLLVCPVSGLSRACAPPWCRNAVNGDNSGLKERMADPGMLDMTLPSRTSETSIP